MQQGRCEGWPFGLIRHQLLFEEPRHAFEPLFSARSKGKPC